jgi:hypothetical protein
MKTSRRTLTCGLLVAALSAYSPLRAQEETKPAKPAAKEEKAQEKKDEKKVEWKPLFNGKDLTDWKKSGFSGEGDVEVVDGAIVMHTGGGRITGITYTGKDFPKTNYEIHIEARKVTGSDFFCGLTFPVDKSHATLICGGWGGTLTGISSINGMDASENSSARYIKYESGRWYDIRLRVTPSHIEAWIDGKKEVEVPLEGVEISTRIEVERSKPVGISAFETKSEIRKIEWRPYTEEAAK